MDFISFSKESPMPEGLRSLDLFLTGHYLSRFKKHHQLWA